MRAFSIICMAMWFAFPIAAQDIAQRPFEADGFGAMMAGDHARCSRIFAAASRVHRDEPSPPFAAARCFRSLGETASARRYLDLALDRGYRNCSLLGEFFPDALPRCEQNAEEFVRACNPELLVAWLADRADRSGPIEDVEAVMKRDAERREVVRIAIESGTLRTADDYFHAAWVLQHGSTSADAERGRDLARKAVALRPSFAAARWLFAAATDRHLWSLGKPQIYGTQSKRVDGRLTLEPFDSGAITDEERARWRIRPAAELRKRIEGTNQ